MRSALILALLASPAAAWEFSPTPICTLTHATAAAEVTVTFDAALPEYAIHLRLLSGTWDAGPAFEMAFLGPRALSIGTDRHTLSEDGTTLTVTDSGFGNVLDGLQYNAAALALSGNTAVEIPLDGAAPEVAAFRRCPEPATS